MTNPNWRDLPFLINGTEPHAETLQALDQPYDSDVALELERQWQLRIRESVRQKALSSPTDAGARRLEALLSRDRAAHAEQNGRSPHPRSSSSSWMERLQAWFSPPLAAACSIVAVQAVVIASLVAQDESVAEHQQMRSGASAAASAAAVAQPHLRVMFRDGTSEATLRVLLRSEGLEIVAGPSAVGEYRLLPRAGVRTDLQTMRDRLQANPAIATALDDPGPVRSEH